MTRSDDSHGRPVEPSTNAPGACRALDVSVIIPTCNTRGLTLDCLESVFATCGGLDTEVIVVDNHSTDGTRDAVKARFPQAQRILNDENLGYAAAANQGLRVARGRFACVANSDTVLTGDALARLCAVLDANPDVAIAGPRLLWADMTLQPSCRALPSLWRAFCEAVGLPRLLPGVAAVAGEPMRHFAHDGPRDVDALVGAFLLVRRSAIDAVGLLDERFFFYCEEVDWCRRFRTAGWRVRFCPEAVVIHIGRGSSAAAPERFAREWLLSNWRYWLKHGGLRRARVFLAVMMLHFGLRAARDCFRPRAVGPHARPRSVRRGLDLLKLCLELMWRGNAPLDAVPNDSAPLPAR